jgi:hypothetical protein
MINIEGAHRLGWHQSHFNQEQPRVPAGHPDGGQWTNGGGGGTDSRIISDAPSDSDWKPGAQYANASRRGSGSGRGGGRFNEPEPGQAARLAIAQARADEAIARVRERDPNWRPRPSLYESTEGKSGRLKRGGGGAGTGQRARARRHRPGALRLRIDSSARTGTRLHRRRTRRDQSYWL